MPPQVRPAPERVSVSPGGVNGALFEFGDFQMARHNKQRARGDHKIETQFIGYSTTAHQDPCICCEYLKQISAVNPEVNLSTGLLLLQSVRLPGQAGRFPKVWRAPRCAQPPGEGGEGKCSAAAAKLPTSHSALPLPWYDPLTPAPTTARPARTLRSRRSTCRKRARPVSARGDWI